MVSLCVLLLCKVGYMFAVHNSMIYQNAAPTIKFKIKEGMLDSNILQTAGLIAETKGF